MTATGGDLEPAYVLHTMAWQETSQILEVLTRQHGRIGLVARGARRPKSRWRSVLQPFMPLRLSWSGRGSLHTLTAAEPAGFTTALSGLPVMGAFYLNELIISLTRRGDPHPELFAAYAAALAELRTGADPEPALRRFELALLGEVGYGLNLGEDAGNHTVLDPAASYEYRLEAGPVPAEAGSGPLVFHGRHLLAISRGELEEQQVLQAAKRLLRVVLAHHLDGRILKTRQVLATMRSSPVLSS